MVGDASFTQAVSTQLTVHGKQDMLLSAFPEPVILCLPLRRARGIER